MGLKAFCFTVIFVRPVQLKFAGRGNLLVTDLGNFLKDSERSSSHWSLLIRLELPGLKTQFTAFSSSAPFW